MAGVTDQFKKHGAEWGLAAAEGFISASGQFAQTAASVGERTANEFSNAMTAALNRAAPDVGGMFQGFGTSMLEVTETIYTFGGALEKLPGKMGELGQVWSSTVGLMVDVAQPFLEIGGIMLDQFVEVGERWREIQRDLLASTADGTTALGAYKDMVRDIASSGRYVDINDISGSIAKIGERMNWLQNGGTAEQLKEFSTRYGEAIQLLQQPLDIEQITGLFQGFDVPIEKTSEQFTQLINLMAETGRPAAQFLTSLDRLQGSARRIGLELPQLAQMLRGFSEFGINEEYITEGMNTLTGRLAQVAERTGETVGQVWDRVIGEGKRRYETLLQTAGQDAAQKSLVAMMTDMTGSSMVANALSEGIMKGVVDVRANMEGLGEGFNRSLTDSVEQALTLSQVMGEIGNRILVGLEPIGDALLDEFQGFGETVGKWFEENNVAIIEGSFKAMDILIAGTQTLIEVTANALKASAGTIEGVIDLTIEGMQGILLTAEAITKVGGLLPGQMGKDFDDTNKSLNELRTGFLENTQKFDIEQSLKGLGDMALQTVPAIEQFRQRVGATRDNVVAMTKMNEAARDSLSGLGEGAKAVQAIEGTKEFKITGNIDTFKLGMEQAGIIFQESQEGVVTGIEAANDIVAKKFEDWYKKNTGKELEINIDVKDSEKNVLDALGIPRSQQVTDSEGNLTIKLDVSSMGGIPGLVPFGAPSTLGAPGILHDEGRVPTGPQGRTAAAYIAQAFPRVTHIGGSRDQNTAPNTHDAGLAIDIAIPQAPGGGLDMAYGDMMNEWLKQNAQQLGIQYIIWKQTMQNQQDGRTYRMEDRGGVSANHYDHIDVQFNNKPVQGPAIGPSLMPGPSSGQIAGMPSWMTPEMQQDLAKAGFTNGPIPSSALSALGIAPPPAAPPAAPAPGPSGATTGSVMDGGEMKIWTIENGQVVWRGRSGNPTKPPAGMPGVAATSTPANWPSTPPPQANPPSGPAPSGSPAPLAAEAPGGLKPDSSYLSGLPDRPNVNMLPTPTPTAPMPLTGDYDADRRAFELQGKQDKIANTEEAIKNLEGEIAKARRQFEEAQGEVEDLASRAQGLEGTDTEKLLADARERELNTYSTLENRLNALQDAYDANARAQTEYTLSLNKATKANEDAALKADKNAEALGKGLVSGILEGLGLDGSVFSDPTQWGIWKLFTGGVNYMGGLADAVGKGEPGAAKPGGTNMMSGLLSGLLPGTESLIRPNGQHWTPGGTPGPGNAMAPTQQPATTGAQLSASNITNFQITSPLTDGKAVQDVVEQAQMQNFNNSRATAAVTTTSGPTP